MQPDISLQIWADPVCPWCLIGKAWLDRALEGAPDHPFAVEWHPFQINPDMPPGGLDHRTYLEAKFGSPMKAVEALQPAVEAARAAGVALDLAAIDRMPDTTDAHRLIHWAGLEGRQTPVMAALMRAHFSEGRDIGNPQTLLEIATAAGLDGDLIGRLLASDADRDAIRARVTEGRERGIKAAPTFIVAGTYVLPGAQPVELWREVLDELAERRP
ncbi:MAG: DsbA family oxidoreductase [Alkalilacustris sp.]